MIELTPSFVVVAAWLTVLPAAGGAFLGATRLGEARRSGVRAGAAERLLAWASAWAAGLMLGVMYAVLSAATFAGSARATIGAALGVVGAHLLGTWTRGEVGRRPLTASTLHSAAEGIAIGAAAAVDVELGLFVVLTLAVHNLGEGTVLGAALAGTRAPWSVALLAAVARAGQPAVALVTLTVLSGAPSLAPWTLGIAAGTLVYLVLAELLPGSYRQSGRTSIAVVVSVAAGIVALVGARTR